ncbi:uncharacterized protein LOC131153805 [Malania oleifera]|uniref:uncharacterized protein LOC131153805 n=1 Tax=Malania oleifera TaxID=397392 RepID=UPI0025AECA1B|nr:uncharacterized protein LOC131153805 [Malania oleifera]
MRKVLEGQMSSPAPNPKDVHQDVRKIKNQMEEVAPSWSQTTRHPKQAVENKPSLQPWLMESLADLGLSLHTFVLSTQDMKPQQERDVQVPPFINPNIQERGIAKEMGKEQILNEEMDNKNEVWEEQLQAMQKANMYGSSDAFNPCLMSNSILPQKLKVLNFAKFSGSECPLAHLGMYLQKMAAHCDNDDLLIHCFQSSLTGEALEWCRRVKIHTWRDLARAFMTQYRQEAVLISKSREEKMSDCSYQKREMTAQSRPMIGKGKVVHPYPCVAHFPKSTPQNSPNRAVIQEQIKDTINMGKAKCLESERSLVKWVDRKKSKKAQMTQEQCCQTVSHIESKSNLVFRHHDDQTVHASTRPLVMPAHVQTQDRGVQRKVRKIDRIPMTYAELFPQLVERHLVAPTPGALGK